MADNFRGYFFAAPCKILHEAVSEDFVIIDCIGLIKQQSVTDTRTDRLTDRCLCDNKTGLLLHKSHVKANNERHISIPRASLSVRLTPVGL